MSRLWPWLLGGAALAGWWALRRRPLPRVQGRLELPGLIGEVSVERDRRGIPTLCADHVRDAWLALGFVHAQDRPFQLDMQRRLGWGRLSECLGKRALKADIFLRRLGLGRSARQEWESADAAEREMLTAYAEGINAAWRLGPRASEFVVLGYHPDKWEPWHAYLWFKCLGHDLACNWEVELLRTALLLEGPYSEQLSRWSLHPPEQTPVTAGGWTRCAVVELMREYQAVRECLPEEFRPPYPLPGSNAWALAGRRSASGFPLLANDPHLVFKVPDYWYEVRIEVEQTQLAGASMPGMPGLILGQNGSLAWGVTNAFIDVQDLFLEKVDWSAQRVTGPGGEESLQVWRESIAVAGGAAREVTLYATPRGPLLSVPPDGSPYALSLAWSGRGAGHFFRALLGLNRARSLEEARESLCDWHLPVLNMVLADRDNIAHQVVGRVPRRRSGSGLVVAPAWEERWQWSGYLDYAQLPAATNPECGYIVSANHSLNGGEHFLSWDFCPGWRAERIEQLLQARPVHDLDSLAAIQCDQTSTLAVRLLSQLDQVTPRNRLQQKAWNWLRHWNGHLHAESSAATCYQAWIQCLCEGVALASLGPERAAWLIGQRGFHPLDPRPTQANRYQGRVVMACLQRAPGWLPEGQSWEGHLQSAFEEAVTRLQRVLGDGSWHWGRLHRAHLSHPLESLRIFPGIGPLALGGDNESPNQTGTAASSQGLPGPITLGATWRFLTDLGDPRQYRTAHCPGQSGHAGSPHYQDGLVDWKEGRYHRPGTAERPFCLKLSPGRG